MTEFITIVTAIILKSAEAHSDHVHEPPKFVRLVTDRNQIRTRPALPSTQSLGEIEDCVPRLSYFK
jgi:hypothetical protein